VVVDLPTLPPGILRRLSPFYLLRLRLQIKKSQIRNMEKRKKINIPLGFFTDLVGDGFCTYLSP
jgi:hypothetical protein